MSKQDSQNTMNAHEILLEFLEYWTLDRIKDMKIEDYVSVGDKNTFCQWIETKTNKLGSIKGITSSKFGIYKRKDKTKRPKNLMNDSVYSWRAIYGNNKDEAFKNIKKEIIQTIDYSIKGDLESIDSLNLTLLVRWKIAFLFSNERIVPIFKKEILHKIAKDYGLQVTTKTKHSEIHRLIIDKKPPNISIYEFASELYDKFGNDNRSSRILKNRKSANKLNTENQFRSGSKNYIASQTHNKIQNKLYNYLIKKYGRDNVFLEENYVDITVKLENKIYLYEVKSNAYASQCIREALGQVLLYCFQNEDKEEKYLFVVGQYELTENEKDYFLFIQRNLKINFNYISSSSEFSS